MLPALQVGSIGSQGPIGEQGPQGVRGVPSVVGQFVPNSSDRKRPRGLPSFTRTNNVLSPGRKFSRLVSSKAISRTRNLRQQASHRRTMRKAQRSRCLMKARGSRSSRLAREAVLEQLRKPQPTAQLDIRALSVTGSRASRRTRRLKKKGASVRRATRNRNPARPLTSHPCSSRGWPHPRRGHRDVRTAFLRACHTANGVVRADGGNLGDAVKHFKPMRLALRRVPCVGYGFPGRTCHLPRRRTSVDWDQGAPSIPSFKANGLINWGALPRLAAGGRVDAHEALHGADAEGLLLAPLKPRSERPAELRVRRFRRTTAVLLRRFTSSWGDHGSIVGLSRV